MSDIQLYTFERHGLTFTAEEEIPKQECEGCCFKVNSTGGCSEIVPYNCSGMIFKASDPNWDNYRNIENNAYTQVKE